MNDPLAPIEEIMRRHNVKVPVTEFHAAVNVCFHRFESEVYDELHQDMWGSLPKQVDLLAADCLRGPVPDKIRMLDIGSGTGLATDSLMRSPLGSRVSEIDLLDTSTAMLARAQKRREQWGKSGRTIEGIVESLPAGVSYDLIITSSVLHHVPDLPSFLKAVAGLQDGVPNALFLHLQDPNGDFLDDPERARRPSEMPAAVPDSVARFKPARILARLKREIKGEQGQDYISKANRELVKTGIITNPLTVEELFSITDIHVRDGGISIDRMKNWLPEYDLLSHRSYGFFGVLSASLPPDLRPKEDMLIEENNLTGEHVSAAWHRR